ncbi:hypothetical protein L596_025266 [Steinernema carpocapsae]|uniref:Uncharacterized protein n=1 Tax=Steinernema carpocapsae TaxID=34508 RepID=A0A4V5ZYR5_STECR|nr:hypothetical protein L596_025266 [Steinernema carpocapsae]
MKMPNCSNEFFAHAHVSQFCMVRNVAHTFYTLDSIFVTNAVPLSHLQLRLHRIPIQKFPIYITTSDADHSATLTHLRVVLWR